MLDWQKKAGSVLWGMELIGFLVQQLGQIVA